MNRTGIRRFLRGQHPDSRTDMVIENVRHYGARQFQRIEARSIAASPVAGPPRHRDGEAPVGPLPQEPTPAAIQEEDRNSPEAKRRRHQPPPQQHLEDEVWSEEAPQHDGGLDELAALEAAAAAAEQAAPAEPPSKRQKAGPGDADLWEGEGAEDSDEDLFGTSGLGPATYAVAAVVDTPGRSGPSVPARRREAPAPGLDTGFVEASLEGIEERLAAIGERPFFREVGLGRLAHHCNTATATVSFWPSTLKWTVSGPGGHAVERALIGPAGCRPDEAAMSCTT